MTYRELRELLHDATEEQLDCDLTVELGTSEECFAAEYKIYYGDILDSGHPTIYVEKL